MKNRNGVVEEIKVFLEKVPGIRYAFIYGSYAENPENQEGEVDLMVVGGPDLVEMDETISKAGMELNRTIYITSFTAREFRERIEVKDESVLEALEGPRIILTGHEKEMVGISNANYWQTTAV